MSHLGHILAYGGRSVNITKHISMKRQYSLKNLSYQFPLMYELQQALVRSPPSQQNVSTKGTIMPSMVQLSLCESFPQGGNCMIMYMYSKQQLKVPMPIKARLHASGINMCKLHVHVHIHVGTCTYVTQKQVTCRRIGLKRQLVLFTSQNCVLNRLVKQDLFTSIYGNKE